MTDLLPDTASLFERTLSQATDPTARLSESIASLHGLKVGNPPPSLLPYLVFEYGLGQLTPYLPNLYELIGAGIDWQRIRGTHAAVAQALGWLTYAGAIEQAPTRRRWWNAWQLALSRLRDDEGDLIRIEGLANLSAPKRSDFWRGHHGYDARELELGYARWGATLFSDQSGVTVAPGAAKWSFGRSVEIDHDMTEAELTALGVWVPPVSAEELAWTDLDASWSELDITWVDDAAVTRSLLMVGGTGTGPAWAVFKDSSGAVIGYRRARARRTVIPDASGVYSIGGSRFSPGSGTALFVEALTDFGDGAGREASSVGFILTAEPGPGHKPGVRWLEAGALVPAGPIVAERAVSIPFGLTVRDRVAAILRF
ncbi:phage tail protein [Xanthobacter sp. 126]|uniref:phage tail protein n=1 Tax=Xanthobacter sp. 126 TaxID=1131814 RepID=UPI00045EC0D9|nr:phage tail protein [Xanthobacter sp. 126]